MLLTTEQTGVRSCSWSFAGLSGDRLRGHDVLPYQIEKVLMHSWIVRELGMERRGEYVALLNESRFVRVFREDFDTRADAINDRGADENHLHGLGFEF